jgi:hypothetical protein
MISDRASILNLSRSRIFQPFDSGSSTILSVNNIAPNEPLRTVVRGGTNTASINTIAASSREAFFRPPRIDRALSLLTINTIHSLQTVVHPGEVLHLTLDGLCHTIDNHPSLQTARILSTAVYVEPNALMAPHRCIVMHIERDARREIWLRLDRRPTSRIALVTRLGSTRANDQVRLAMFLDMRAETNGNSRRLSQRIFLSSLPKLNIKRRIVKNFVRPHQHLEK